MSENNIFTYSCFKKNYNTIQDVIIQMDALNNELLHSNMQNLRAFNTTYLIITKAVEARLGSGYFEDDASMPLFDIIFAQYYFYALKDYLQDKEVAPAWRILFDACKKNNLFQIQYMAIGVNAHVNNDLPLSLSDMDKNNYQDYLKINHVISNAIPEVISSIKEKNIVIENIENNLLFVYKPFLAFLIKKWRHSAWQQYALLKENRIVKSQIEIRAKKIANYLCILTSNKI
ncbi:MAG: DUF5995 family protein [bacterium]|nr:DUF5995 family protein [bacterium]